ncbi:MAG: PGPGW domain-containing protein [Candidatus Kariarchaeaceae archaeon]
MVSNSGTELGYAIKTKAKKYSKRTVKELRRFAILIMGLTIMLIGVLLLVLPGPGVVTIIFGLTLLASEFYWAKNWLKKVEKGIDSVKNRITPANKEE